MSLAASAEAPQSSLVGGLPPELGQEYLVGHNLIL